MNTVFNQLRAGFANVTDSVKKLSLSDEEMSIIQRIREQGIEDFALDVLQLERGEYRKYLQEQSMPIKTRILNLISMTESGFKRWITSCYLHWDLRSFQSPRKWRTQSPQYNVDCIRNLVKQERLPVKQILEHLFEYQQKQQG